MTNLIRMESLESGIRQIMAVNKETEKYGLTLTRADAVEIISNRERILKATGRIELSYEVIKKFIELFSSSSYISQDEYASVINELLEVFYYLKNESNDDIPDDILIERLKDVFENKCGGCIELISGKELMYIIRNYNRKEGFGGEEEWN